MQYNTIHEQSFDFDDMRICPLGVGSEAKFQSTNLFPFQNRVVSKLCQIRPLTMHSRQVQPSTRRAEVSLSVVYVVP